MKARRQLVAAVIYSSAFFMGKILEGDNFCLMYEYHFRREKEVETAGI